MSDENVVDAYYEYRVANKALGWYGHWTTDEQHAVDQKDRFNKKSGTYGLERRLVKVSNPESYVPS